MLLYFSLLIIGVIFSNDVYGSPNKSDRIVGGRKISVVAIPYQAQLLQNNIQICGATILSPTWILTAAHCIDKSGPKWTVLTGSDDASTGGDNHELKRDPIMHPQYDRQTTNNDIALIELATPIKLNDRQKTIPLATREPRPGDMITVSGFGKLGEHDDYSDKLMVAMAPVIDVQDCARRYHPEPITDNMFCAGSGETDTCQGDSGGPAVINNELVGVVSFGKVCASSEHPGVYTKVRKYIDWIVDTTAPSEHKVPHRVPPPPPPPPPSAPIQQINPNNFNWYPNNKQLAGSTNFQFTNTNQESHNQDNRYTQHSSSILGSILSGKVHITFSK